MLPAARGTGAVAGPLPQLHLRLSLSPAQTQPLPPLPRVPPCIDSSTIFMPYQGEASVHAEGNCGGTVLAHRAVSLPGRPAAFCL